MENLPAFISIAFCLTTVLAIGLLYKVTNHHKVVFFLAVLWIIGQSTLAVFKFYTVTDTIPPRMVFLLLPPLFIMIALFTTSSGRSFISELNIKMLTLVHVVRIPVELILFGLYTYQVIPELMTFEGRNLDILAGLTAPFIYYFGFVKKVLDTRIIIGWNVICTGLLLNIAVNGILSVPTPFQQFAFDQPNIAMLYFPYLLLPGFIVPLVLFSHIAAIRQLITNKHMVKNVITV